MGTRKGDRQKARCGKGFAWFPEFWSGSGMALLMPDKTAGEPLGPLPRLPDACC